MPKPSVCMRKTQITQPMAGDMLNCVLPWMSSMAGGLSSGCVRLTKATQNLRVEGAILGSAIQVGSASPGRGGLRKPQGDAICDCEEGKSMFRLT